MGKPVCKVEYYLLRCSSTYRNKLNLKFLVIIQSVTADSSLRSPTGGVEELYPTPHIYEQMTAQTMATDNMNLEHNTMINIDIVAHMILHYTPS